MKGIPKLICPYCGHDESRVADSRPSSNGAVIWRRRHCEGCQQRYPTTETVYREKRRPTIHCVTHGE
jgi:transcriptional regulator NrdR family protein